MGDPKLDAIIRARQANPAVKEANNSVKKIRDILGSRLTKEQKKQQIQQQLIAPRGWTEKVWLRELERGYNHSKNFFTIISFKGQLYEIAHIEPCQRNYADKLNLDLISPLRDDLMKSLDQGNAREIIARLEKATRFRKLMPNEVAQVALSKQQRDMAILRAKDNEVSLAQWLFNEKNWLYLVNNCATWLPSEEAGFFSRPTEADLLDWPKDIQDPRQGDKRYLKTIADNIANLRKKIYNYMAEIKLAMAAGKRIGRAGPTIQFAYGQLILELRKKLHILRTKTEKDEILTGKLINIQIIWKKDLPLDTGEWRKQGLLD
jgi:hypothetical protein